MASTYIKLPSLSFDLIDDSSTSFQKTWSSNKIEAELNTLGDVDVRSTRFESISSGTSGSLALQANQEIVLDDFGGTTDAIVTTIESGRPTNEPAQTSTGDLVAATLDDLGNWSLIGVPDSYPVALIYRVREPFKQYNDTDSSIIGSVDFYMAAESSLATRTDTEGSITYVGNAAVGSSPADAVWRIYRVLSVGEDVTIQYANGNSTFSNVWNNRASLTYV